MTYRDIMVRTHGVEAARQRHDHRRKTLPPDDVDELRALEGSLPGKFLTDAGRANTLARIEILKQRIASR